MRENSFAVLQVKIGLKVMEVLALLYPGVACDGVLGGVERQGHAVYSDVDGGYRGVVQGA